MKLCAYCQLPAPKGHKHHAHCSQAQKRQVSGSVNKELGQIVGLELARVINQPKEVR
jgi:hypothetical protein